MSKTVSEALKTKRRDYLKLVNTIIEEASKAGFEVRMLDTLIYSREGYPFLMLQSRSKQARHNAVILSGMHGDEVYAIDSLIWSLADLDDNSFNFWIFPVVNVWGYRHMSRVNGARQGINWRVGKRDTKELALIFKNLPSRIDLAIDVHGDVDRYEVYAYERRIPEVPSIARPALHDVAHYFDVLATNTLYKEPVKDGVVTSVSGENTMEEFLFSNRGARYSITLELPGKVRGSNRTVGGARLIVATLNNFLKVADRNGHDKGRKSPETHRVETTEPRGLPTDSEGKSAGASTAPAPEGPPQSQPGTGSLH